MMLRSVVRDKPTLVSPPKHVIGSNLHRIVEHIAWHSIVKRETFPQGKILIHIKQPSLSSKPQASSLRMVHDTHHRVVRQKVICSVMTETGETRISHQHTVLIITKPQIAFLVLIDVTDTPGIRQQMFRK